MKIDILNVSERDSIKMKKRLLSIILAAVMVVSLIPATVFAADYTDTQGHWGEKAIDRWSSYDIVSGKGGGIFDPDGFMTRAEAAKVFANLFKLETKADLSDYTDVGLGKWYDDPIAKCINAGIIEGYGDGIINPTGTITREMFFVMFCRALGIKPVDTAEKCISDASNVSNYARGYITALANKGYILGMTETENGITVAPKLNINRASVMSLMDKTIKTYVNTTEKITVKDGLTLIVVDNANVTFANNTKDAEVYVFGKNTSITNAPVGTKVITSENATGTKVNGKLFNKDTTTIVEKKKPSGGGSYTPPTPVSVTGVTLNQETISLQVGESVNLTATVLPDNATNKNVTWTSSDESVATVNNGTVSAIAAGTATITVTTEDGNKTATCAAIVAAPTPVSVTGVNLALETISLQVGENVNLTATVLPDNATNKNVTWTSSDESVATVNNGTVSAIAAGTATITVTTEDGNKTATCAATVTAPTTTYTVTFDMQDHGTPPAPLAGISYGSTIPEPSPEPTAVGYKFGGWYKEAACENKWNFGSDTVTKNTALYAKWNFI